MRNRIGRAVCYVGQLTTHNQYMIDDQVKFCKSAEYSRLKKVESDSADSTRRSDSDFIILNAE